LKQRGLDLEASYRQQLGDLVSDWEGSVTARFLAQRVLKFTASDSEGRVQSNLGENTDGSGSPYWSWNFQLNYEHDAFSAGWTARGISAGVQSNDFTECTSGCPNLVAPLFTVNDNHMPGTFYMDVNFSYRFTLGENLDSQVFLSVTNITDTWPTRWPFSSGSPASYDLIGRTVRGGLRFQY
jgi:iron complex outermembrane recepter protein